MRKAFGLFTGKNMKRRGKTLHLNHKAYSNYQFSFEILKEEWKTCIRWILITFPVLVMFRSYCLPVHFTVGFRFIGMSGDTKYFFLASHHVKKRTNFHHLQYFNDWVALLNHLKDDLP